jgi:hypothetical protein
MHGDMAGKQTPRMLAMHTCCLLACKLFFLALLCDEETPTLTDSCTWQQPAELTEKQRASAPLIFIVDNRRGKNSSR